MTWYTVYEASTEEVIASGTGPQCAKALGMTMGVTAPSAMPGQALTASTPSTLKS